MALRSSSSASIASLKSKVKSYASSAQSYNDAKMQDDYTNGLLSPSEYLAYIEKRMGSIAPGTSEYISWSKKLRNTELDRVQAPLEEGVKSGTVLPGDLAEWMRTNRLPEISIDSPKYAQMMNQIQSYDEKQVSLEDVFANNQINQLKNIDARAADAAKVEYYASRINRFSNPIKQAEAENTYNQVLTESQKNQVRFSIQDMNRELAALGSDSAGKAAYKYQQYQQLYTYALENGLYEEADRLSIQMMNAQTSLQGALSAESSKKDSELNDDEKAFKNYIRTVNLTSRNAEDAAKEFTKAYEEGWVATQEVVDEMGNKSMEKVNMPAYSTILLSKIDKERKTYGDSWWAKNPDLAKEVSVMGEITDASKKDQPIDLFQMRKKYNLTGNELYFPALVKLSNIPQLFNADGTPKEMVGSDVDAYLKEPNKYYYQTAGNRAYEKVTSRTYVDPETGKVVPAKNEKAKIGDKEYDVATIKMGNKDFVVVPQEDGSEEIFDYDPSKSSPADVMKDVKSLQDKASGKEINADFWKSLGTYAIPGYGIYALGRDANIGGILGGAKQNIAKKAEEHAAQVRAAEEEKARKAEAERVAAEAAKRQVAQQVTQQIKAPTATPAPMATKPVGFQTPVSTAKAAAQKTTTTPISGPGGIDFQTSSIITRDAQKLLSEWVGQGKPSFYTEKNIIPALAKQYGRQESEIAPIVYAERKKSEYGGE